MIRDAVVNDAQAIAVLMLEHPLWQFYELSVEKETVRIGTLINNKSALVDELNGDIQGFVIFDTGTFGGNGYIQLIGTKKNVINRGVGTSLLINAHKQMSKFTNKSFLLCTSTNVEAQRFYERHGYIKVGELPNWIKDGVNEYIFCNYNILSDKQ